jgi:hypothetical protein
MNLHEAWTCGQICFFFCLLQTNFCRAAANRISRGIGIRGDSNAFEESLWRPTGVGRTVHGQEDVGFIAQPPHGLGSTN